ncbi:hypothetical protein [Variovorax sp. PBL-E5]|uniref:hypothetical protein n=1 Tax=Variovorax sp. PBL-E5 TaxID=434014 RepID=UPI001316E2FD|nr:hypothetical protein [Variovorax sp. PBL-E5]VTU36999.1 hypothetical protein E5CHR_04458 [Variovorax sp. PBL-E5]
MAGLLDFLTSDDGALGLGLLAAGGPTTDPNRSGFGQRLAGAVQNVQANRQAQLQSKYMQSQIDENTSQAQLRAQNLALLKRKMDMQAGLLGYPTDGSTPAVGGAGAPAAPAMGGSGGFGAAAGAGGAAPSGGASPTPATPVSTPAGPMSLAQISQRYQIPYESLALDLVNNDGKGIADMVFKRGTPDMQVANGYAYDRNKLPSGFMPQVTTSSTGQTSLILPNAQGTVDVSAPNGAVPTFQAYQDVQDRSRAAVSPGRPVIGPDGRPHGQSQLAEVGGVPPPVTLPGRPFGAPAPDMPHAEPGMTGNFQGDPSHIMELINSSGASPQEKANAIAALNQQMRAQQPGAGPAVQGPLSLVNPPAGAAPAPLIGPGAGAPASSSATGALDFSPAEKGQQAAQDALLKAQATSSNAYKDALDSRVQNGAALNMRMQAAVDALQKFQTGGGKETRAGLAQTAQAFGAPESVVNGIAGGDLGSMQEFQKLAVQQAMETLKASMGGQGRISQSEFRVFQANNPNLNTDPNAVRKIFDFNTRLFNADLAEQQAYQNFIKTPGNSPGDFPGFWARQQQQLGITNPSLNAQAAATTTAKGGTAAQFGGYGSPQAAISAAQNALMRDPSKRAEVQRRLQSIGLSLPGGS